MKWLDKVLEITGQGTAAPVNPNDGKIRELVKAYVAEAHQNNCNAPPRESVAGAALVDLEPADLIAVVKHALADDMHHTGPNEDWFRRHRRDKLVSEVLRRALPFTLEHAHELLALYGEVHLRSWWLGFKAVPKSIVRAAESGGWLPALRQDLEALHAALSRSRVLQYAEGRKMLKELELAIAKAAGRPREELRIERDAWGDKAIAALGEMDEPERAAWTQVLNYCASAKGPAPSAKWLKGGAEVIERFGEAKFATLASAWLALLREPTPKRDDAELRRYMVSENNADVLKGIAWLLVHVPDDNVASALSGAATMAFKKVPNIGARSTKVGNACLQTLKMLPGLVGAQHLAALRTTVKKPSQHAAVEKALAQAAERLDMSPAEAEELATPDHGFVGGKRTLEFGDVAAELTIDGTSVTIAWRGAGGKPQKSEPAQVRRDFPEERKALKRLVDDAEKTLAAVRDRLERLPMATREWPVETWRERYFDHPVAGALARRLIWRFRGTAETAGLWNDERWVDEHGAPLEIAGTTVLPWHPVFAPADTVRAFRALLAEQGIVQPFKQAHREIYLLTDAERRTETYSNRFAAHVLRQHQLASLCTARGWKYRLQGGFDSQNAPTLELPQWRLCAEFWVEPPGDGADMGGTGIYLHVLTDQVRFRRLGAPGERVDPEPLRLESVPTLVLSEVMRDVDLFVGVTSIGADPTWSDGGPGGRHAAYWSSYAWGELSAVAETRKEVLAELLPRLALRDVAHIDGKFLVVKGKLRSYKIHLGSGNILMAPNDQYLCIVPDRSPKQARELRLPFEGDTLLSVILSKAFLVASDDEIKDPTILRQMQVK